MSFKRIFLAFTFLFVWALTKLLAYFPGFTEQVYSNGLYQVISKLSRYAFGWIPFSVGDVLYTIGGILIIRWLFKNWRRSYKDFKNWGLELLTGVSFIYLAFNVFWAFNYYRPPLYVGMDIGKEYSTEQLVYVTEELIHLANKTHASLQPIDTLKVTVPHKKSVILKSAHLGYANLAKTYPQFKYQPTSIKGSLYSIPLTYMGFSGYLNPFTNEAQVDILIPKYQLPMTASHEIAHQVGYAAENEANFIGMLASIHHPEPYFQYSGQVFGLRYCLNELYRRDPDAFETLRDKVRPGIYKNFQESRDFWNAYENPLEPLFKTTYDNFLKANNQDKGIESYSYVVALIVNYYASNKTDS